MTSLKAVAVAGLGGGGFLPVWIPASCRNDSIKAKAGGGVKAVVAVVAMAAVALVAMAVAVGWWWDG